MSSSSNRNGKEWVRRAEGHWLYHEQSDRDY